MLVCYFELIGNGRGNFLSWTVNQRIICNCFIIEINIGFRVGPSIAASCVIPEKRRRRSHQELDLIIADCCTDVVIDSKWHSTADAH